jgi:hypothetical protein
MSPEQARLAAIRVEMQLGFALFDLKLARLDRLAIAVITRRRQARGIPHAVAAALAINDNELRL